MRYEYIGHVPNRHGWERGKQYHINPKRDNGLVVCNIQEVSPSIDVIKTILCGIIYDDVPMFRRDWKVVSVEPVEITK